MTVRECRFLVGTLVYTCHVPSDGVPGSRRLGPVASHASPSHGSRDSGLHRNGTFLLCVRTPMHYLSTGNPCVSVTLQLERSQLPSKLPLHRNTLSFKLCELGSRELLGVLIAHALVTVGIPGPGRTGHTATLEEQGPRHHSAPLFLPPLSNPGSRTMGGSAGSKEPRRASKH